MEAFVGEPFLLSTYSTTKRTSKSSRIYATYHRTSRSSEGYVTVAAQGDGIHVLDISTMHPVISHTLGPTTTFSCPSVTVSEVQGADHICTTYAGVSSEDEGGRSVWMWKENLSSSVADRAGQKKNKKSVILPHSVSGLYIVEELPGRVVVTSSRGDVSVLHGDLQVQGTRSSSCDVLKTFVFSRKECTFLPFNSTPITAAIVVSVMSLDGRLRIQVLAVDLEDKFYELGDIDLGVKPETFCDVSCSTTGFFSVLLKNGTWSSFELKPTDDSIYPNTLASIHLSTLSFITSSSNSAECSIVSLGSSHVLLGGLTGPTSNREIVLLLWDLSFSVLLTSRTIPFPSNISSDNVSLDLTDALASSNVLLWLSPASAISERRKSSQSQVASTSGIWAVPVTVPPISSIANAIGKAAAGKPWVVADDGGYGFGVQEDTEKTKVLDEMRSAMDRNQIQNANSVFFDWEKREVKVSDSTKDIAEESSPLYGYNFTKEVLSIALQPSKPSNTPYSSQVVKHLLEKKTVSAGMIEGGLLAVLRLRNDWKSITLALTHVTDLQEMDIVECLCFILARHRRGPAMQVDSAPSMEDEPPTLRAFMNLFLRYNFSGIPLRAAFRRYFSDGDDVVCLLEVLDSWIGQWAGRDLRLLPSSKGMKKNEYGVLVLKPDQGNIEIPSMLQITTFLQSLLDTSFLNLIQTPSAHRILKKIQAQIDPEIKHIERTEQLRGPLDPFVRAQAKVAREAKVISEGGKAPVADWRQRKKLAHAQAGMIGLYQLEELTL